MRKARIALTAGLVTTLGLGLTAAALGTVPAATAATPHTTAATVQNYAGGNENAEANKAFFDAVVKSVAKKRAANPDVLAVTVYYNASAAPTFASQIAASRLCNRVVNFGARDGPRLSHVVFSCSLAVYQYEMQLRQCGGRQEC